MINGHKSRSRFSKQRQADMQSDFQEAQSDYKAAKRSSRYQTKRTGIPALGASADWHYRRDNDYLWISEVARDIDRNDVIAGQILDRVIDNEVQDGFRLNCMTGDEKLDRDLEQRWEEESNDPSLCDVTGTRTFHDQERLVAREEKLVGDIFAVPIEDDGIRAIQLLENYRCISATKKSKRNIVNGIELDDRRKPQRYYFTKDSINPNRNIRLSDLESVEAYNEMDTLTGMTFPNVWHVLKQKRPTQTRGISAYAPLFDVVGIHDDIQYSKLVQQQINSFFAFLRTRDLNFQQNDPDADTLQGISSDTGGLDEGQEELIPGMEMRGLPGETITGWSPNIPNTEWFQHVKLLLTFIGINLGAPLVMVLMDASQTNFSGYRGAIDLARLSFRCNQRRRVTQFYRPYFNWRLRSWLDDDEVLLRRFNSNRRRVNLFRHVWNPPRWPYIEPTKDALSDLIRESNTLTSPRRRAAERGDEYATIVRESIEDRANGIRTALAAANDINSEFNLADASAVTWQHLYQPPMPQGVTLNLNAVGEMSDSQPGANNGTDDEG